MGENSFAIIAWIKKKFATIISNAKCIKHFLGGYYGKEIFKFKECVWL